ncbi:MAG: hypothetical protein RLZZ522_2081 [Verrucomicrobiota bacterium]
MQPTSSFKPTPNTMGLNIPTTNDQIIAMSENELEQFAKGNALAWADSSRIEGLVIDAFADAVCHEHRNLHHLGHGEIVPIGDRTALIGTRGWADGRAGWGRKSWVRNPDHEAIKDF